MNGISDTASKSIETVLLAGGQSRRMGVDKAVILVEGVPLAERIATSLLEAGYPMTVLGGGPIKGCAHLPDDRPFEGALTALAAFEPSHEFVFVVTCDAPRFDPEIVEVLASQTRDAEAVMPVLEGRRQPLMAVYSRSAWEGLREVVGSGEKRIRAWSDRLRVAEVAENTFVQAGVSLRALRTANTPEELEALLRD